MSECKGYIKLYRCIEDNPIWTKGEYSWGQAWIDLLLLVNHSDNTIVFESKNIVVHRGSTITSMLNLSKKWKWTIGRVSRYLNYLETSQMITQKRKTKCTIITIVNYDNYQDSEKQNEKQIENKQKTNEKEVETNKNDKNDKNDKNNIYIVEILDYLNSKVGSHYKASTDKNKKLINARLNNGYTVEDFKTVIDNKCSEWLQDAKMRPYLRPITLFGNKFESYLNEQTKPQHEFKGTGAVYL